MNSLSPSKKILFFVLSLSFSFSFMVFSPSILQAQTVGNTSLDGIDISSTPANPSPGSTVAVSIQSFSIDLDQASISWTVDGKTLTKGNGLTSINITAPASGKSTQVSVSIHTSAGANIQKVIDVESGDIEIVWETSGYSPPLYQGKVPFAYQNTITFTAMPHLVDRNGKAIDPRNLIYKWSNGSNVFGDQSGYGRQSITIQGSIIPRELDMDVVVTSTDGNSNGEAGLIINASAPSLEFYQDDPLYGVLYNTAIGSSIKLSHNELKVVAAPYGFDIPQSAANSAADNMPSALVYNWNVNNVSQSNLSSSRSIVLRVADGQQGTSAISLTLANTGNDILQGATAAFNAIFNTTGSQSANSNSVSF
jgi:hypothetical protein